MSLIVQMEFTAPGDLLRGNLGSPALSGAPPATLAESPQDWARQQLHRRVFAPLLRSETPASLDKKVRRIRPIFEEIMDALAQAFLQQRGVPTASEYVAASESQRRRVEANAAAWGPAARAYLERACDIHALTLDMEARSAAAQGGAILLPAYQRDRLFSAFADFQMLALTAEVAPVYARPPASVLRLASRVGDHLAFLTWQAAIRLHAHVLAAAPETVRQACLSTLETQPAAVRERLPRLLDRVPAALAAKYRALLARAAPSEEDVEIAVEEACAGARAR